MNLHPLSEPYNTIEVVVMLALSIRDSNGRLWIIENPIKPETYLVCQEAEFGTIPMPSCAAVFAVLVEADRFTDPAWRINLGPGVWPIGRKL